MMRLLAMAAISVSLLVASGCSIQPDASPNDLPAERADVFGESSTGDEAAGTNRIYLLAPTDPDAPQRLRSVQRAGPSAPASVLASLFAGPNATEREAQIDTAIPAEVELLAAPRVGERLIVDLSDAFDELTPDGLRLAVAQIVSTATDIDGVRSVQLRIEGETRAWPLGKGEITERALTMYDYPGLAESSQPAFPASASPIQ